MSSPYSRYAVYIKPVIKNPYVRTYSSIVFSLIAIAFFSFFAIRPTFKTIIGLQRTISEQKQVLESLNQKSANLDLAIKNYEQIDPDTIQKINDLVPTKPEIATLISDISVITRNNQASFSGLQVQPFTIDNNAKPPTIDKDLKEIELSFNIAGSYTSLTKSLDDISKLDRLILFDNVVFNKTINGLVLTVVARTIY